MAGVVETAMATWRTALAASLTNLPENGNINDPPDTDRTYFAVLMDLDGGSTELGPEFGSGALYGDTVGIRVVVAWMKDIDDEAFAGTIATDLENIQTTMMDDGNKGTAIVLITPNGWNLDPKENWTLGTVRYRVRFRVAANLT